MTLTFTPKTEEEILYERLMPEGEYYFEIIECEERKTPKTEFFRVKLTLTSAFNNRTYVRHDNITLHPSFAWKLRNACEAMGLLEKYGIGKLSSDDFMHRNGSLIIAHRKNKDTGMLEDYVKDYGIKSYGKTLPAKDDSIKKYDPLYNSPKNFLDDDIPDFT